MKGLRAHDAIPGSTLLLGEPGSGKTGSALTYVEAGLKLYFLATEANGVEVLIDSIYRARAEGRNIPLENVHWKTIVPAVADWDTMADKVHLANTLTVGEMQKKDTGLGKENYRGIREVIKSCKYMPCDRTGVNLGNLAECGDDWAFVVDSLTGLSTMAMQTVKGNRPTMTEPEYGVAQEIVRDLVARWCALDCFFTLTSHVSRRTDKITQISKITTKSVGKALDPDLPPLFSEVVGAYREGGGFWWKTIDPEMSLKHRSLPLSDKIAPSFVPIVERYRERKRLAAEETAANGLDPAITSALTI